MLLKMRNARNRFCAWWLLNIKRITDCSSDDGSADGCFWWLDMMLLLGGTVPIITLRISMPCKPSFSFDETGIRSELTTTWVHERKIRIFSWSLSVYHAMAFVLELNDALNEDKDAALVVLELMKVAFITVACLKVVSVALLKKPIAALRQFICSNRVNSGDAAFDEMEQLEFINTVRSTVQIIFGFIVVDTVLLVIPNSMKNDLLGLPHLLTSMGKSTSRMLSFILASCLSVSASPKYFSSTACVGVTLVGMRTKLRIISHRFKLISQQAFSSEEQCFKRIDGEVKEALVQHLEYWSHLQTMKDLIGKMFFLVHYFSIFAVGALLYVCHEITPNSITLVIIAGTSSVLLEYFLLCCFVESLADEADAIEQYIFEISAQIPFCSNLRSEYVQLQSTLMIIWINTRNGMSMNCIGLFEINISAFAALIDVAYSVLMFLINMG